MARVARIAAPLAAGLVLALLPTPAGLTPQAWHYFAVFVAVIIGVITEPIPSAAIGFIGVAFIAVTQLGLTPAQLATPGLRPPVEAIKWALAGFANSTVWLIFGAFVFAMGYEQTGLGRRIALLLVRHLGGRTLGLGYAIAFTDLVIAPFTPSNTARSAGTIFPVLRSIPELYGSRPTESPRKIGAYLMWVAFASTCVTSSMFITALAPNPLAIEFVKKLTGVEITWMQWFLAFLPIGVPLLVATPLVVYWIYPPEIRASAAVPAWAARELATMGRVSRREITMAILVVVALGLWIGGGRFVDPTTVVLVAISLMLVSGVVSWEQVLANTRAWNVLAWFATLVVLGDGLSKVGFAVWFGQHAAGWLGGCAPPLALAVIVAVFFLVHYLSASLTGHVTALMPVLLAAGAAVPGVSVPALGLLMGFAIGLMGVLTPYATGPAPVYYGCGFIARRDFWRLGLVFGLIFLVALLAIGVPTVGRVFSTPSSP